MNFNFCGQIFMKLPYLRILAGACDTFMAAGDLRDLLIIQIHLYF